MEMLNDLLLLALGIHFQIIVALLIILHSHKFSCFIKQRNIFKVDILK